jgi:AcrR family transcriptional regulator
MVRLADPRLAERRRRQILDAALACFLRRGFHQATMQEICAEARISPGALYRYFDSKADIIAAIAEDAFSDAADMFERVRNHEELIGALCTLAQAHFDRMSCDGENSLMADVMAEAARDPLLNKNLERLDQSRLARIAKALATVRKTGAIDVSLDPAETADIIMSAMNGVGLRHAMLRRSDLDGAVRKFRVLIDRLLAPRP